MTNKYCNKCQKTKPIIEFSKNKKSKDGLQNQCKLCVNEYNHAYYKQNDEKIKKNAQKNELKSRKKDLEAHLEKARKRTKKYRLKNPEKVLESSKRSMTNFAKKYPEKRKATQRKASAKFRKNNPEKRKETQQKYAAANPDKNAAKRAKYRATQTQATPLWFEKEKVDLVYKKALEWGFEVDHVYPLQGEYVSGLHCWANLQLLDGKLNKSKGNRVWIEE